jgi:hypothetical protein
MALLALLLGALVALAPAPQRVAARGKGGLEIARPDLEKVLLERHGFSENGRELLELFLKARLLEHLGEQQGIRVSGAEVDRRWNELERQARAGGGGLAAEIQRRGLTPEQFRDFLRLAVIQERLTRRALGLREDAPVSGDQQELWIRQEIQTRGLELLSPTEAMGPGGVMARCGEIAITRAEFGAFLLERLGEEAVAESAWHLLLERALERRLPDLGSEARAQAIEAEVDRRRAKHRVEYPGVSFEQRLAATGRTLGQLRGDPSVAIAALSRLWVDRNAGPEGVRSAYEKERAWFEARHGEAVHAALLFLVAGRFKNDLCPRTFEEAERDLERMRERCRDRAAFSELVARHSEEPGSKKQAGDLGWITRGETRLPVELREAMFHLLDTGGTIPEEGRVLGPIRLDTGVALLWLVERRASPSWEEMSERVHEELRRRLIEDVMPRESVELTATRE